MTPLDALVVWGFLALLVAIAHGLIVMATRAGWLDDPQALPWESDEGQR